MSDKEIIELKPRLRNYIAGILFLISGIISSIFFTPILIIEYFFAIFFPFFQRKEYGKKLTLYITMYMPRLFGINVQIKGLENIPNNGKGVVFLSKHMSMYETIIISRLPKIKMIARKSLSYIPFYSLMMRISGVILIERSSGLGGLLKLISRARDAINTGYSISLFPEGTRTKFKQKSKMHLGIMQLYPDVSFIPIALNFGLPFGKGFLSPKFKGIATLEIMPPIPSNVNRETAREMITSLIQVQSDKLCQEFLDKTEADTIKVSK